MPAKRVLVVDDALELGRLLQAALGTLDPNLLITVVPSAEEAQLEAARHPIDLVITDVRLPGISGLELTRRIRSRHKHAKIILITGVNDPTIRKQSLEAGADFFFKKPLSMPDFLSAVQEILEVTKAEPVPAPVSDSLQPPQTDRIAEALANSRHALAAYSVALLDNQGHILAQEGDIAEKDLDASLLPTLMNTVNSGEKVSHLLGAKAQEAAYSFKGRTLNLVISPLGGSFAVLVLFKGGRNSIKTSIAVDEVFSVRKELERTLADMGVALHPPSFIQHSEPAESRTGPKQEPIEKIETILKQPPMGTMMLNSSQVEETIKQVTPQPEVKNDELDEEPGLEALLGSADRSKPDAADVENFWDTALNDEDSNRLVMPDKLTYEQARRMGLAPDTPESSPKR